MTLAGGFCRGDVAIRLRTLMSILSVPARLRNQTWRVMRVVGRGGIRSAAPTIWIVGAIRIDSSRRASSVRLPIETSGASRVIGGRW